MITQKLNADRQGINTAAEILKNGGVVAIPTDNQLGAWKYLDYIDASEDYNNYYYNAREIDSREYAEKVVGFDLAA